MGLDEMGSGRPERGVIPRRGERLPKINESLESDDGKKKTGGKKSFLESIEEGRKEF